MKLPTFLWHFRKNPVNTIIMMLGLSIAFSLTIYISGYVFSELSYDQFIKDKDRIYRLYADGMINGRPLNMAVTCPKLAIPLKEEIPEIEETLRVRQVWTRVEIGEKVLNGQRILQSDPNLFSFFHLPVIAQKGPLPLEDISNVMISRRISNMLFSNPEVALGKSITIREGDKNVDYFIGGVFEDITDNFHLTVEIVQSVHVDKDFDTKTSEYISTFIKTREPVSNKEDFDIKLTKSQYAHQYDISNAWDLNSFEDLKWDNGGYLHILTEPLTDVHFSKHKFENAKTSDRTYVYGAIVLAFLVVIISAINYFNLSIATLSKRFKNYGIRKTIGATKIDIASTFLKESLVFFMMVFIASYLVYLIIETPFTEFTGFDITMDPQNMIYLIVFIGLLLLILIGLSNFASYLIVSRQSSQELLNKTNQNSLRQFAYSRNFFLILQFTLSSFVIVASMSVNKQIRHFADADKGFDSSNIITFNLDYKQYNKFKPLIEEIKKHPLIKGVGSSDNTLGNDLDMSSSYFNTVIDENYFHASYLAIDDGFPEVYDLELVEGRYFDDKLSQSEDEVIINESAAKEYMLDGNVIDDYIIPSGSRNTKYKVVGVVKDFNFRTLHHPVEPLVMKREPVLNRLSVKFDHENTEETISLIKNSLNKYDLGENFSYTFMDDQLASNYYEEARFRNLLSFITFLAIFISCLGLFAISQITVLNKRKEIAIRKINGAKVAEILAMLNRSFVKYVAIAFVLASAIGWYAMNRWLENFAFKTTISWWIFGITGLMALGIAVLTITLQSWKAATRNPVEALRYE